MRCLGPFEGVAFSGGAELGRGVPTVLQASCKEGCPAQLAGWGHDRRCARQGDRVQYLTEAACPEDTGWGNIRRKACEDGSQACMYVAHDGETDRTGQAGVSISGLALT